MGDVIRPDWSGRLRQVWRIPNVPRVRALVVSTPANLQYLCGFEGSAGLLVLTDVRGTLLLDGRYARAARAARDAGELGPLHIEEVSGSLDKALAETVAGLPAGEIGFEADRVTVQHAGRLATRQPGARVRSDVGLD